MKSDEFVLAAVVGYIGLLLLCLAAWATHVIVCIKTSSWLFLIAGAIAAPVGIIHGIGIWLGVW